MKHISSIIHFLLIFLSIILPLTICSVSVKADMNQSRPLKVLNSGFENGTDSKVDSWLTAFPGGNFSITAEKAYEGEKSLKLDVIEESLVPALRSEKIFSAREGYTYKASVMCYAENEGNRPSVHIEFWNNDGMGTGNNAVITYDDAKPEGWQKLTVNATAPVGTTMVTILLEGSNSMKGTCYFDCVDLEELPGKLNLDIPYGLRIMNASFENLKEANIGYWKQSNPELTAVVTSEKALSGNACLKVSGTKDKSGVISNNIAVFEGKEYAAIINTQAETGTALITIDFWKNDEEIVQSFSESYSFDSNSSQTWKKLICKATAPIGTQYATIKVEADQGIIYFDDADFICISTSVANASMENINTYGEGSFPYNWKPYGDIIAFSDGIEFYDGILSLGITSLKDNTGGVISSMISNINEGRAYTADIMAKFKEGTMNLVLEFWDADFNSLRKKTQLMSGESWQRHEVSDTAPTGAKFASIAIESTKEKAAAYFDKTEFASSIREIGSSTQLFIDDYLIEKTTNMTRNFHQAQKTDPVLVFDQPWEENFAYIYGTVIYDEEDEIYKMWYISYKYRVCYATSTDGINWHKPLDLGIIEYEGSTDNNMVSIGGQFNVIKDLKEPDLQKRYKRISLRKDKKSYGIFYSPDGIQWAEGPKVMDGADVVTVVYDEYTNKYIGLFKINIPKKRIQRNSISNDMLNWSVPIRMNSLADPLDSNGYLRVDGYGAGLYPYEGVYIGFNWLFEITEGKKMMDGPVDVHLIFSRDLSEDWQRPTRVPIIPRGEPGTWDSGSLYTAAHPIRMGDEIWMYYGGFDATHQPGTEYHSRIGIAKWRLDGFASIDSSSSGVLETKPLTFKGDSLYLNAEAIDGNIKVELLDENENVIPGFSKDDCSTISGDNVKFSVDWGPNSSVKALENKVIKMRIYSENSKIYSFGFKNTSVFTSK